MSLIGRLHAARTLARMARWLANWREVWAAYRASAPLPPLRLRSGLVLHHGPGDDPIMLLHEVFAHATYRDHVHPPSGDGYLLDLGANIGAVTLDWAGRAPKLRVHAYEPHPRTHAVLARTVATSGLGGRVTVHAEAVGRTRGTLSLDVAGPSVEVSAYKSGGATGGAPHESVSVPLVPLDEAVARLGDARVWLLKCDTEGAEADILEGASPETLARIDQVALEYHDHIVPEALARCRSVLERAGFACRVVPATTQQGMLYAVRPGAP